MTKTLIDPVGINYPARSAGIGRVFYVSHVRGANTNNGLEPNTPFLTITHALGLCLADRGDYIYVLDAVDGTEPVYPVPINIARVHLIGITPHGIAPGVTIDGGGNACFSLSNASNRVEIAGFGFRSDSEDGIYGVDAYGVWVHHCSFGGSWLYGGGQLRNGILTSQPASWLIEDCFFGGGNPLYTLSGIGIDGSGLVNTVIRRNIFQNCQTGCVRSSGGDMEIGIIIDNYFFASISEGAAVGWAINIVGVDGWGGIITNNHAMQTGDGTGANPYRDLSTGVIDTCRHGWGANYDGPALSLGPATA